MLVRLDQTEQEASVPRIGPAVTGVVNEETTGHGIRGVHGEVDLLVHLCR